MEEQTFKRCSTCGETKTLGMFTKDRTMRDGVKSVCKPCRALETKRWAEENPEKKLAATAAWRQTNPNKSAASARASCLKKRYGLTVESWERMHGEQNGACAICQTKEPGKRGFHVDHDHSSQTVRQLLCACCNVGLGHLKDSPTVLVSAIAYLVRHGQAYPTEALAALLPPPL